MAWEKFRATYDEMGLNYIEGEYGAFFERDVSRGNYVGFIIGEKFVLDGKVGVQVILQGEEVVLDYVLKLQAERDEYHNQYHLCEAKLLAQKAINRQLEAENKKLKEFAQKIIRDICWNLQEPDGGTVQESALRLGLIEPVIATEEDVGENSDYEVGDTIYKFTNILKGCAE